MKTLKHARMNANWLQKEAAQQLKITQPLLSHYENGSRRVPKKMFQKMCNLYKVKPEQIELKNPTDKKTQDSDNRSNALRWALAKIVGEENIEEIIQLSLMIVEAEK